MQGIVWKPQGWSKNPTVGQQQRLWWQHHRTHQRTGSGWPGALPGTRGTGCSCHTAASHPSRPRCSACRSHGHSCLQDTGAEHTRTQQDNQQTKPASKEPQDVHAARSKACSVQHARTPSTGPMGDRIVLGFVLGLWSGVGVARCADAYAPTTGSRRSSKQMEHVYALASSLCWLLPCLSSSPSPTGTHPGEPQDTPYASPAAFIGQK